MSFYAGRGRNPAHGPDTGPPPPLNRPATSFYGGLPPQPLYPPMQSAAAPYTIWPAAPPGGFSQQQPAAAAAFLAPPRGPVAPPVLNPAMPAANMTNSTGGVGCEPGYNYFFPAEHTKLLVFRTGATPPWQLPLNFQAPFHAVHVPVNTTIGELLAGFGATNPNPKKNKIVELHQGGSGKWYKGMAFHGDKEKDMDKTLKSVGWDATRTGLPGQKPVVYLYVTKG